MMTRWFTNENVGLRQFWHPVARASDLDGDGPHGIRLLGVDYVLAKLGDTSVHHHSGKVLADPQSGEAHTRADKITVELRRVLNEVDALGATR